MIEFIFGLIAGLVVTLIVNENWYQDSIESTDDWAQKCLAMNDDWAEFSQKLIDKNKAQEELIAALQEQNEELKKRVFVVFEEKEGDSGD